MSLLLGWGAYVQDKNTSARLCAKNAGGLCVYFWDTTVSGLNCSTLGHYVPLGNVIRTGYILRRHDITISSCCFSSKQTDF